MAIKKSIRPVVPLSIRDAALAALLYAEAVQNSPEEYPLNALSLWWVACDSIELATLRLLPPIIREDFHQLQELMQGSHEKNPTPKALRMIGYSAIQLLKFYAFAPPRVFSLMQQRILKALDGKVRSSNQLLSELANSKETLFGKGGKRGLTELVVWGCVISDPPAGGYYRPDKPPSFE